MDTKLTDSAGNKIKFSSSSLEYRHDKVFEYNYSSSKSDK